MLKISHQMDLILEANFPNKVVHKMTPVESKEWKIQVHDLLQKGLIWEGLSPCVISAILAPKKNGE